MLGRSERFINPTKDLFDLNARCLQVRSLRPQNHFHAERH